MYIGRPVTNTQICYSIMFEFLSFFLYVSSHSRELQRIKPTNYLLTTVNWLPKTCAFVPNVHMFALTWIHKATAWINQVIAFFGVLENMYVFKQFYQNLCALVEGLITLFVEYNWNWKLTICIFTPYNSTIWSCISEKTQSLKHKTCSRYSMGLWYPQVAARPYHCSFL